MQQPDDADKVAAGVHEDGSPVIGEATVRAARRCALLAAGIVFKPELDVEVKPDCVDEGGDIGYWDHGSDEGDRNEGADK